MFKLFNNKTKKIEDLDIKKKINIYLCGPTVYDHLHIGNFRNIILFDCLIRILIELKYDVFFIQNLTDIDDKIVKKAIFDNKTEKEITKKFTNSFFKLLDIFNINKQKIINVTDNIESIKKFIKKLLDLKKAYFKKDGIYFNIKNDKNYGRLKIKKEFINNDDDFVIWKFKDKGITWSSPWGKGRPGWHIECATIINKYFKNNLTIHGGGKDLLFPHHENEMALLNVINDKLKNTIWLHNGFVQINSNKISKSKVNEKEFLVKDLLKKYSINTIRFFFYFSNYKDDIDLNLEHLLFCKNFEKKIKNIFKKIEVKKILNNIKNLNKIDNKIFETFLKKISFDLNTINTLDFISKQLKDINFLFKKNNLNKILILINTLKKCLYLLNIKIKIKNINEEDKKQLFLWNENINKKNFKEADKIRKILQEKDIF